MKYQRTILTLAALATLLAACTRSAPDEGTSSNPDTHVHDDGTTHTAHAGDPHPKATDHAHDEVSLGTVEIGGMQVELAQGHGTVSAGKEGHLVVKLPYSDQGATRVRAWIGTRDSTLSMVGLGEYAASHDDYDIHAMAPAQLPVDALWWIEIEKPDGTTSIGSARPIME